MKKILAAIFVILLIFPSCANAQSASEATEKIMQELQKGLDEAKASGEYTEEELKDMEENAGKMAMEMMATIVMMQSMALEKLKEHCSEGFSKYCASETMPDAGLQCLKDHQKNMSQHCQKMLEQQYGVVLEDEKVVNGIAFPKGSRIFYHGDMVAQVMPSKPFVYKDIEYAAEQVQFQSGVLQAAKLTKDQFINGIKYSSKTLHVFFDPEGNVENGVLAEDVTINGITYKGGTQLYYKRGKYRGTTIEDWATREQQIKELENLNKTLQEKPVVVNGIEFPKGTKTDSYSYFRTTQNFSYDGIEYAPGPIKLDDRKIRIEEGILAKDTVIEGIKFKAGTEINHTIYSFSTLLSGTLAEDQTIGGILYKGGKDFWASKEDNSKWWNSGTLAQDTTVKKIVFKKDTELRFMPNMANYPVTGTLAHDQEIQGIKLKSGERHEVGFDINMDYLESGTLAEDTNVDGVLYKAGQTVMLNKGKITYGTLARDSVYKGIKFKAGTSLSTQYTIDGTLAEDTKIGEYTYKANAVVRISQGSISPYQGTLAQPVTVNDKTYEAGTPIELNKEGQIIGVRY